MEALRVLKIALLLLLCCGSSVTSEDGIESSGDGEPSEIVSLDIFDTSASGEGPDTTSDPGDNAGIISDIAEQELNGTYIPISRIDGNLNLGNGTQGIEFSDTTTKSGETTVSSTTEEIAVTSTAIVETTNFTSITEPVTTAANETFSWETTTTEEHSSTTTPVVTTSLRTTQRTTTVSPSPKTSTPVSSTTTFTSTSGYELLPCSFTEEDFECSVDILCQGTGEVDCTETDDLVPVSTASRSTEDEYDDEYEDSAMFSTEPSQLTGRVPQWKRLSSVGRHRFLTTTIKTEAHPGEEITSTTAKVDLETSTTTQEAPTSDITIGSSDTTPSIVSVPTTEKSETELPNTSTSILHVELPTQSEDSSTVNGSSEVQESSSEKNTGNVEASSGLTSTVRIEVTTREKVDSSSAGSAESVEVVKSKSRRRRNKRQNKQSEPGSSVLSSSESLKLTSVNVGKEGKDSRLCRIKGNLSCSPAPTLDICKGIGRCEAPVEKKEKSTGPKGVENWAIAVIATCATAGVVTIILLVYLAITSWKKLKVQPQNGVTTLTYVNNASP